jgi:hypothetical protein
MELFIVILIARNIALSENGKNRVRRRRYLVDFVSSFCSGLESPTF